MIGTLIGGIVLTSAFDLYVQSSKTTQGQSEAVKMQLQVKSSMDLMVREMQLMYGSPTIKSGGVTVSPPTAGDTISFQRIMDSGYSSGGSASTLNDTRKTWAANAFAPSTTTSYTVTITAGTGSGQWRYISGDSATQLTLDTTSGSWGTNPDTTSLYLIYRNEGFARIVDPSTNTVTNKLGYQRGSGGYTSIADDITTLAFSQPDSASCPSPCSVINITLTGRTKNPEPHTGKPISYILTEAVRKRN
jgi:hypothetical protein